MTTASLINRREFCGTILPGAVALSFVGGGAPSPSPTAIDWSLFVGSDSSRYAIDEPWIRSGWKCATDRRIAIRVGAPNEPDTPDPERQRFPKMLEMPEWRVSEDEAWLPWPSAPPVWGFGDCPECDGDGYLGAHCACDGGSSACPCFARNGRLGKRCQACVGALPHPGHGEPEGYGWLPAFHRVGCQLIHQKYHRRIMSLPGPIEFIDRPDNERIREWAAPIRFRFANGDGLVMPCDPT